jgi:hypothetical protein
MNTWPPVVMIAGSMYSPWDRASVESSKSKRLLSSWPPVVAGLTAVCFPGCGMTRCRSAGGYLLQLLNGAVVVAFGSQPGCHLPCGGAVAGIFDNPLGGRPRRADGRVLR